MSYCPNCKCWSCQKQKIRDERKGKRLATEKTLQERWEDAEPVGVYRSTYTGIDNATYEVRRGPLGGYYAKVTETHDWFGRPHTDISYKRIERKEIEGYISQITGKQTIEPRLVPVRTPASDMERRRRLRELHPDRLGREQTPEEREEFTRLAGGGA